MNGPFFLETLARNGDVLHRHRVDKLPITIGRGYSNDFILDDAHTAATHAVVEMAEDGALVMRDLGSQNGIVAHGKRQATVPINGTTGSSREKKTVASPCRENQPSATSRSAR